MKVLLIDDHALIREALRSVFTDVMPQAEVLDAVGATQALEIAQAHSDLELVVLDLSLPDGDGLDVLKSLRSRLPDAGVVVLSASSEPSVVAKALRLGAQGFIPKSASYVVMLAALQLVLAGGIYVPPEILAVLKDALPSDVVAANTAAEFEGIALTERQRDVLALLVQGKSNKLICRELQLAEPTVKNHITAILKALKVSSRMEAIVAVGVRTSTRR
ncbi:MAG: response regulator transcription factor [Hyphomicrobiaceae bacterium]